MPSDNSQTMLLIPADLGSVESYDPTVLLGRNTAKGSLPAGDVFLRAALNEMVQILRLCESLEENHRELLRETKAQYDNLNRRKKELELLEKRRSIFKPLQLLAIKRAKRAFLDNTQELWTSTRTTSERLKRALLSTPSANLDLVESESIRRGDRISGLAVPLPPPEEMNAPGTQEALAAAQKLAFILASPTNPFADPTASNILDGQTSTATTVLDPEALSSARSSFSTSPSSPGSASSFSWLNLNLNYNIVNNTDSNAPALTINNGSENIGSSGFCPAKETLPLSQADLVA